MRRQRPRNLDDRELLHSFYAAWVDGMTSEHDQECIDNFIRADRYLAEINRRDLWSGKGCVCANCVTLFSDWTNTYG